MSRYVSICGASQGGYTTNTGKDDNLVLRKTMMERNKNVVTWDSQTAITEPDRYTDEQGVDDVDEEDSVDEQ